jgi:hypothetical protein
MSILHVNQIAGVLHKTFDGLIDLSDASPVPLDRERAFLSRALAAFAVMQLGGATAQEAADSVIDGTNDNGIDAVFFDRATKTLFAVQAKWHSDGHGSFERGEILKLIKGFTDLTN